MTKTNANAVEAITLSKFFTDDRIAQYRQELAPGEHKVSFDAHIEATLNVGEDYTRACPQKARPWLLLALALDKMNEVDRSEIIAKALLTVDKKAVEAKVKEEVEADMEKIAFASRTLCNGAVRFTDGEIKIKGQ